MKQTFASRTFRPHTFRNVTWSGDNARRRTRCSQLGPGWFILLRRCPDNVGRVFVCVDAMDTFNPGMERTQQFAFGAAWSEAFTLAPVAKEHKKLREDGP